MPHKADRFRVSERHMRRSNEVRSDLERRARAKSVTRGRS